MYMLMSDLNQNEDCLESAFEYNYIICKIENTPYKFITIKFITNIFNSTHITEQCTFII